MYLVNASKDRKVEFIEFDIFIKKNENYKLHSNNHRLHN